MFVFHIAESLNLIALATGAFMFAWAVRTGGKGTGVAKFFGVIVMILSIISFLCTLYFGMLVWSNHSNWPASMQNMMNSQNNPSSLCTNCPANENTPSTTSNVKHHH